MDGNKSFVNMKTIFIIDAALKRRCDGCHGHQEGEFAFMMSGAFFPRIMQ
jgi:hypothetical protein